MALAVLVAQTMLTRQILPAIQPPKLPSGGCIGIISPAYPSSIDSFTAGEHWLTDPGYRIKRFPNAGNQWRYLAGTDEERLADVHNAFADDEVDAIWCARGGYGSARIVEHLDIDLIASHPKPLIGFSDITVLQQAIYQKTGLITFYGPMVTSNLAELPKDAYEPSYTLTQALAILTGKTPLKQPLANIADDYTTINSGIARGPLLIGNLTLLASLCGTPHHPNTNGHIVVIEDWKEDFYSLDRQFTQLRQAGIITNQCAGVLLGDYSHCTPQAGLALTQLFEELLADLTIPVGYGFSIGHGEETATLPNGCMAEFNANNGQLSLLSLPVS
jgi:muramoyltetrapeptide carboxypeptidase